MPEYVTKEDFEKFATEVLHQLRVTNWLLNGRRGAAPPAPPALTAKEFHNQRRRQREHLAKRRAEKGAA